VEVLQQIHLPLVAEVEGLQIHLPLVVVEVEVLQIHLSLVVVEVRLPAITTRLVAHLLLARVLVVLEGGPTTSKRLHLVVAVVAAVGEEMAKLRANFLHRVIVGLATIADFHILHREAIRQTLVIITNRPVDLVDLVTIQTTHLVVG
jgi:hypothetical protein